MDELIDESKFTEDMDIMPAPEILSFLAGGAAGDWIVQTLGIAALEPELGRFDEFIDLW